MNTLKDFDQSSIGELVKTMELFKMCLKDFNQNSLMKNLKNFDQETGETFERFRSEF